MNEDPMSIDPPSLSDVFIVIAAYNEEKSITTVTEQLLRRYPNVVVVDDGSTDTTFETVRGSKVFRLKHIVNRGQGAALQTGIRFALEQGARVIVTFDADGQHDPDDIPAMIAPVLNGECDVTLGSRFLGHAHNIPITRKMMLKGGILFTWFVSGIQVTDVHNGFRAFSREAARQISIRIDRMGHASELLDQIKSNGLRYKEIPINVYYTNYSLRKGQSSWNAFQIALQFLFDKVTNR
jgi:glycosyltransferase involved in cell wall biosynthesis